MPLLRADHITDDQYNKILTGNKLKDYLKGLNTEKGEIVIVSIKILSVFMFGPNIGFIDIFVDSHRKEDISKKIPGYVLLRGNAVSILIVINGN